MSVFFIIIRRYSLFLEHKLCHEILHFRIDGKCRESAIGRGKTSVISHRTIRFTHTLTNIREHTMRRVFQHFPLPETFSRSCTNTNVKMSCERKIFASPKHSSRSCTYKKRTNIVFMEYSLYCAVACWFSLIFIPSFSLTFPKSVI